MVDLCREHGLKSHRQYTFKVSRDPDFSQKVADGVGLYLSPSAAEVGVPVVPNKFWSYMSLSCGDAVVGAGFAMVGC